MAKSWVRREKQVAEAFGVSRNKTRGMNYYITAPDTEPHEYFSIEIKERAKLPKFLDMGNNHYKILTKPKKFVDAALNQASKYYPHKIPLAVFCEKYRKVDNSIVCIRAGDFAKYDEHLNLWNEDEVLCYRLGYFIHKYEYIWTQQS